LTQTTTLEEEVDIDELMVTQVRWKTMPKPPSGYVQVIAPSRLQTM
jgi:hypothetical protein